MGMIVVDRPVGVPGEAGIIGLQPPDKIAAPHRRIPMSLLISLRSYAFFVQATDCSDQID
jgi:hypothetical protein